MNTANAILKNAANTDWGARCNQAITIISDMVPENYNELFEQYNNVNATQTPIRLFTYLIGHEDADEADIVKMNCENPGWCCKDVSIFT